MAKIIINSLWGKLAQIIAYDRINSLWSMAKIIVNSLWGKLAIIEISRHSLWFISKLIINSLWGKLVCTMAKAQEQKLKLQAVAVCEGSWCNL